MPGVMDAERLGGGHPSSVSPGPFLHGDCPAPETKQWAASPPRLSKSRLQMVKLLTPGSPEVGRSRVI